MLEKNVALKQEIADLNARIAPLVGEMNRVAGASSTPGRKIGAVGMAALGIGLAAVWGPGGLLAWCCIAIAAGMIGAVTGWWVGRKGGKWWEDRSRVKITKEIRSKREALLEAKMRHLEQADLEPGTDFVLNDLFFPEVINGICGKPDSALFLEKMKELEARRREKGTVKIKLKILNLSDMDLKKDDLEDLLRIVLKIFDIETLILKNNHLSDSVVQHLSEIICQEREAFSRLRGLDLSGNDLTGSSLGAIEDIASALDLIDLNLSNNKCLGSLFKEVFKEKEKVLIPTSIEPLARFLSVIPEKIPSLKYLKLRNIGFFTSTQSEAQLIALRKVLREAPFLEYLDVRNNPLLRCDPYGVNANITLKEFQFDQTGRWESSEIQAAIAQHNNLFSSLSKEQPVLVGLLNAKHCNTLSPGVIDFLSRPTLRAFINNKYRFFPASHFNYNHIGEILESILLSRKAADQESDAPISEQEVIAYIKSYYSPEKKQATPSIQKTKAKGSTAFKENSGEQITYQFSSEKSQEEQFTPKHNTAHSSLKCNE